MVCSLRKKRHVCRAKGLESEVEEVSAREGDGACFLPVLLLSECLKLAVCGSSALQSIKTALCQIRTIRGR